MIPVDNTPEQIPDSSRTTRAHAGEAINDARNWPGYALIAVSLALLGGFLTAAGGGFEGWALVTGIAAIVCFVAGSAVVIFEHRRVKAAEGRALTDQQGH